MVGNSEAGIYSYIYTLCTILNVICISFDNAWTPWVFVTLKDGKKEKILSSSKYYIKLFTVLTIGFICVMPEITKIVASSEYWGGMDLLIPLSIANYFIFLYMLPVNIEYYYKKTKYISIGTVLATVINVILNIIFISIGGYKMAAYTTVIAYVLLFVFHWKIASKNDINSIYDIKFLFKYIVILFLISISVYFLNRVNIVGLIYRYFIVFFILVYIYRYKDVFISMIKDNRSKEHENSKENS